MRLQPKQVWQHPKLGRIAHVFKRTVEFFDRDSSEAWYTWRVEALTDRDSDFHLRAIIHDFKGGSYGPVNDVMLGYCSQLTESQARMKALS